MHIEEILTYLPHRYPFLLVDRVVSVAKEGIVAYKNISISEGVFQGHFPGHPIYPGVMIIEGMAQAGGILIYKYTDMPREEVEKKAMYFASIDNAKFRRPIVPGDRLEYRVSIVKERRGMYVLKGEAYVDDKLAAQADFKAMLVDKE